MPVPGPLNRARPMRGRKPRQDAHPNIIGGTLQKSRNRGTLFRVAPKRQRHLAREPEGEEARQSAYLTGRARAMGKPHETMRGERNRVIGSIINLELVRKERAVSRIRHALFTQTFPASLVEEIASFFESESQDASSFSGRSPAG